MWDSRKRIERLHGWGELSKNAANWFRRLVWIRSGTRCAEIPASQSCSLNLDSAGDCGGAGGGAEGTAGSRAVSRPTNGCPFGTGTTSGWHTGLPIQELTYP